MNKATPKQIRKRKKIVSAFLKGVFNGYDDWIKWKIELNDDADEESTAFLVEIKNTTNNKKHVQILSAYDDGGLGILRGEDFDTTDRENFLMWCFFDNWLTYPES
jgi:hypothetical protein